MKYCSECLQPDTRPNTIFQNGVCPACVYSKTNGNHNSAVVNYVDNVNAFKNYIKPYLANDRPYDCVLGVSGGKDSTSQALFARDVLGLNPILVCLLFPPLLVSRLGTHNLANLSRLGFNIHIIQISPDDWRKMMYLGLQKYGNPLTSTEQALYCSVPQFAIREGYKLILWGENPALQLGDMNQLGSDAFDGDKLRKANTIKDGNVDWCQEIWGEIKSLERYKYPTSQEYERHGLKTAYMGPAMSDWSMINNTRRSALNGFDCRNEKSINIGDNWGAMALDQNITVTNQRVKYLKFGFGRMTDYMNDQIRNGMIDRQSAINYVERYDGKCTSAYMLKLSKYFGISYSELWNILDKFVNKKLFMKKNIDTYEPLFEVGVGLK
ncbi:N-acetyl sugar amidotransferase [bacterium]|nr:N-acetyl sugar amidotransferase [bacterium]